MGTTWEYAMDAVGSSGLFVTGNVDVKDITARLNWYGAQGWELVAAYPTSYGQGGTHFQVFVYKREKGANSLPPPLPAQAGG